MIPFAFGEAKTLFDVVSMANKFMIFSEKVSKQKLKVELLTNGEDDVLETSKVEVKDDNDYDPPTDVIQ